MPISRWRSALYGGRTLWSPSLGELEQRSRGMNLLPESSRRSGGARNTKSRCEQHDGPQVLQLLNVSGRPYARRGKHNHLSMGTGQELCGWFLLSDDQVDFHWLAVWQCPYIERAKVKQSFKSTQIYT